MAREVLPVVGAAIGSIWGPWGQAIGGAIGSFVGNAVDPLVFKGPSIADNTAQTSRDGLPIPITWGIVGGIAGNIIQRNALVISTVRSGSKKEGITESEKATRTYAISLGRGIDGPISGVIRCWENNKLIYDTRTGSGFPNADNVAFEAATTIYLGTEDQLPDSELEAEMGVGLQPAYRGLAYCVFNNRDLTSFASSIPQYKWELWYGNGVYANRVMGWWEIDEASGPTFTKLYDQVDSLTFKANNGHTAVTGISGNAAAVSDPNNHYSGEFTNTNPEFTLRDQIWGVTFWFRTPASPAGEAGTYLTSSWYHGAAATSGQRKWRVMFNSGGDGIVFSIGQGPLVSNYTDLDTGDISLQPLTWYHCAATHNPDTDLMSLTVSERGQTAASTRLTTAISGGAWQLAGNANQKVEIGRPIDVPAGTVTTCYVDMLAFWGSGTELTAAEVNDLFVQEWTYSDLEV